MIRNIFIVMVTFFICIPYIEPNGDELTLLSMEDGPFFNYTDGSSIKKVLESGTTINVTCSEVAPIPFYLGQDGDIRYLKETVHSNNKKVIFHGRGAGAATVLNYLGLDNDIDYDGIILECCFASGNSALVHREAEYYGRSWLKNIPLCYYWLPYFMKFNIVSLYWYYWPSGKQPIKSIDSIKNDIPIVIIHNKDDSFYPYHDACALYYKLSQSNNNVYFISQEFDSSYANMRDANVCLAIKSIFQTHGLIDFSEYPIDNLNEYQPDPSNFKTYYDDLMFKEERHKILGRSLAVISGSVAVLYLGFMISMIWSGK